MATPPPPPSAGFFWVLLGAVLVFFSGVHLLHNFILHPAIILAKAIPVGQLDGLDAAPRGGLNKQVARKAASQD